jgi:hypothetical protein
MNLPPVSRALLATISLVTGEINDTTRSAALAERRAAGADRRRSTLLALWVGSFARRRQSARRAAEHGPASTDWHHAQWLAVAIAILLLSCADALLTLTLLHLGAEEANPFMAPLVTGSGRSFAFWKLGLTSTAVIILTVLARVRAFGRFPAGWVLYAALLLYIALVGYELWLLEHLTRNFQD